MMNMYKSVYERFEPFQRRLRYELRSDFVGPRTPSDDLLYRRNLVFLCLGWKPLS